MKKDVFITGLASFFPNSPVSNDEMEEFLKTHDVDIAALTMPKQKADAVAKKLVDSGVHAIWNFAHVDLELTDKDVVVENVHLSDSLMQLSYNIVKNQSAKVLANVSLKLGKMSADSACCYIYHQPKMPEALKKMKNI